jgi:hypothetical protein
MIIKTLLDLIIFLLLHTQAYIELGVLIKAEPDVLAASSLAPSDPECQRMMGVISEWSHACKQREKARYHGMFDAK